ncbi:MAG TPA: type II toxin-antitoxin system ParD family antitoxin [Caulobacteraceae bacterium]|nr:type II toxin-antitoxin system ParD family antitoxin [Caulobacteraceae bacterium]
MSEIEKVSVALTAELAEKVRAAVRSGDYATSSEVVRDALRDWSERRDERDRLRRLVDEGIASGVAPRRRTAAEINADGRRRLTELQRKQ